MEYVEILTRVTFCAKVRVDALLVIIDIAYNNTDNAPKSTLKFFFMVTECETIRKPVLVP